MSYAGIITDFHSRRDAFKGCYVSDVINVLYSVAADLQLSQKVRPVPGADIT